MLRNALLETDGTPEVMTIIQVFTQLFVQVHQNENKQVGQDLLLNVSFQWEDKNFCKKITILLIGMVTEYNEWSGSDSMAVHACQSLVQIFSPVNENAAWNQYTRAIYLSLSWNNPTTCWEHTSCCFLKSSCCHGAEVSACTMSIIIVVHLWQTGWKTLD